MQCFREEEQNRGYVQSKPLSGYGYYVEMRTSRVDGMINMAGCLPVYLGLNPRLGVTATRPNTDTPVAPVDLNRALAGANRNVNVSWVVVWRRHISRLRPSQVWMAKLVRQPAVTGPIGGSSPPPDVMAVLCSGSEGDPDPKPT